MLPELPDPLKRFDSIVEAHEAGDKKGLIKAIKQNETTLFDIVLDSTGIVKRYVPTLAAMALYLSYLDRRRKRDFEMNKEVIEKCLELTLNTAGKKKGSST